MLRFFYALLTASLWGGADLFYKRGNDRADTLSHLKTTAAVGIVMGVHAFIYSLTNNITITPGAVIRYLPVSFFYILSMLLGYAGLRYLELSVASPVQNSSGAVTTLLLLIFLSSTPGNLEIAGILCILAGTIALAFLEQQAPAAAIKKEDKKYRTGAAAFIFPCAYCLLDGMGTFLDGLYLDEYELVTEDEALIAYELTFFLLAVILCVVLRVKKAGFSKQADPSKGIAALLETAGQYFYVFAMADNALITAPLVSSYCVFSIIFSRLFLKEKLNARQYTAAALVVAGILLLAVSEAL